MRILNPEAFPQAFTTLKKAQEAQNNRNNEEQTFKDLRKALRS